jgi:glycosyltransferase involved in cell wall biosynthesis
MEKIKVYIGKPFDKLPIIEVLSAPPRLVKDKNIFEEKDLFSSSEGYVEIVNNPEECEYFLLPHSYNFISNKQDYIKDFEDLANKYNKKIIVFLLGDSNEKIYFKSSIIFRMSQYKTSLNKNEFIMPAYAQDLGGLYGVNYREKNVIPTVGFCGWADVPSPYMNFKYNLKYLFWNISGKFINKLGARVPGVILREKLIKIIYLNKDINKNIIIRRSYGGSIKTIGIPPVQARKEYVECIKNSDYFLCPRGDGNFSVRFYETLSLGRIPVLIDTDIELPYPDLIDYNSFLIKINMKDINNIDSIILNFHKGIDKERFESIQKKCRQAFDQYLSIHVFFRDVLKREFLAKVN